MPSTTAPTELRSHRQQMMSQVLARLGMDTRQVVSLELAPAGNSRETWIVELAQGAERRKLVFRCDPDHWIRPAEMRREIDGLKLAERAGVPAPKLLLTSDELDVGRPYLVCEYVRGTSVARKIIRDPQFAPARARFATDCGRILAGLHGAVRHAEHWPAIDPLAELESHRTNAAFPSPVLAGALRWLSKHQPAAPVQLAPVHRDFRLGNLMIDDRGIVAVLDWETCHLSDPYEDLAWLCSPAWRYGSDRPVGGIGELDELLDSYASHSGLRIDMRRLQWWRVLAAVRWGLASGARPRAGFPGDAMEEAAIARQVCRQEHYVLTELRNVA